MGVRYNKREKKLIISNKMQRNQGKLKNYEKICFRDLLSLSEMKLKVNVKLKEKTYILTAVFLQKIVRHFFYCCCYYIFP